MAKLIGDKKNGESKIVSVTSSNNGDAKNSESKDEHTSN